MKSNGSGQGSQKSTDQVTWRPRTSSLDDDQIITSSSSSTGDKYAKFYDCNFCEKGFSNAQALGGHMNIHRRDRAKLREELTSGVSSSSEVIITDRHDAGGQHLDQEKMAGRPKWLRIYSKEEHRGVGKGERVRAVHGQGELLEPLLLFDDRPASSASEDGKASANDSRGVRETGLDLELRLGLEPPEPSIPRRRSL